MNTTLYSVCPQCGTPFHRDDRTGSCPVCQPARGGGDRIAHDAARGTTAERGYDNRWRRLSERARFLQPFCTDCGSTYDLTTDHTPEAWARRAAGKVLRLADIDVVCRRCNSERGAARGRAVTRERCPVCGQHVAPTPHATVCQHRNTLGQTCTMSGQPFPERQP